MKKKRRKTESAEIKIRLKIKRQDQADTDSYMQEIDFVTIEQNMTVATALETINREGSYRDVSGNPVAPIAWECSCMQKKCGACAMVIDGVPRLACDSFLRDYKKEITIEPLRKFPVIKDLMVDRAVLFSNLEKMKVWAVEDAAAKEQTLPDAYNSSRCLQCGCCLEVCPNFDPKGEFQGAAGFVPAARLLVELSGEEQRELRENYKKYIYGGCGKSLACGTVCPAGIDVEHLLLRSNAVAFWGCR